MLCWDGGETRSARGPYSPGLWSTTCPQPGVGMGMRTRMGMGMGMKMRMGSVFLGSTPAAVVAGVSSLEAVPT